VLKKEHVEHARLRALAQAIIQPDKGVGAFDDYQKVAFPWLATQKKRDADAHIRLLHDEVARGALAIRPLWENKPMRSRLKTKLVDAREPKSTRTPGEMDALYAKLGMVVPVR
jgi:hypothetical protein